MKLGVISDLHIDKRVYRTEDNNMNKFERHTYNVLDKCVEEINKEKVDICIICGDIFETANPSIIAMEKCRQMFNNLTMPVLVVSGNHDFNYKNMVHELNPISLCINENVTFADYEPIKYEIEDYLFVLAPYVYREQVNDYWLRVKKFAEESTAKHKILVSHGITEKYAEKNPYLMESFYISNNIAKLFNLVLVGHIHDLYTVYVEDTKIISPGAIVNWQGSKQEAGPLIIEDMKVRRIKVPSCYYIKLEADESNINNILDSVEENIYRIQYFGNFDAIDNNKFIEAKNKAMNLQISIEEQKEEEVKEIEIGEVLPFMKWVETNYPEYLEEFSNAELSIEG